MNNPIHQISLYLDNALEPEQLEALLRWVEASPENAELFTQVAMFDSDLREELGIINQIQPVPAFEDFQADRYELNTDFRGPRDLEAAGVRPRRLMLAALLLIAGTLGLLIFSPGPGQAPQPSVAEREPILDPGTAAPRPVASVLRVSGTDAASGLAVGTQLTPGRYELLQGFIEVGMQLGTTVIVQAPCRFELIDDNQLYLAYGRLTADVPEAARLFTVQTPSMSVVDLGTRFGVYIESDGHASTSVFEGVVEAQWLDADPAGSPQVKSLVAGERLLADPQGRLLETVDTIASNHDYYTDWDKVLQRVTVSGQARFFAQPPADIGPDGLRDPDLIVFQEKTATLDQPINVWTELAMDDRRDSETVPAGTKVISYMIHFYPGEGGGTAQGTMTFPGKVLGLVTKYKGLVETQDLFAVEGVAYVPASNHDFNYFIDGAPADHFQITGENQNILQIQLGAATHSDQTRVLVEVPASAVVTE